MCHCSSVFRLSRMCVLLHGRFQRVVKPAFGEVDGGGGGGVEQDHPYRSLLPAQYMRTQCLAHLGRKDVDRGGGEQPDGTGRFRSLGERRGRFGECDAVTEVPVAG